VRNVPVSQLQDVAAVKQVFDAAYPPASIGNAFVCWVADTIVVMNSRENEDVTESYSIPLDTGPLKTLSGTVGPHSYLVGKLAADSLWLQSNGEYAGRGAVLVITSARKPDCQIEPASAVKESRWDEAQKTLNLRLSHQEGAVEARIK